MVYIVATLLRKAADLGAALPRDPDALWQALMLLPEDYSQEAIGNPRTRALMDRIAFVHGGPAYDARYPDGIPTSVRIGHTAGWLDSGLVMYPAGHARNRDADLPTILQTKFQNLGRLAFGDRTAAVVERLENLEGLDAEGVRGLYDFEIESRPGYE